MKNLNLKLASVFAFSLLSVSTFAQLNWKKGGNDATPGAFPPTIGTDATWNAPLNFVTNGVQRMRINSNTGATAGFVGINVHCTVMF